MNIINMYFAKTAEKFTIVATTIERQEVENIEQNNKSLEFLLRIILPKGYEKAKTK